VYSLPFASHHGMVRSGRTLMRGTGVQQQLDPFPDHVFFVRVLIPKRRRLVMNHALAVYQDELRHDETIDC
jgi:hypothetical protein